MVLVTNEFQSQYEALTHDDFVAGWKCINEMGGLCFFNGGRLAGASQPHKHMQFLPTPIIPGTTFNMPTEALLLAPTSIASATPLVPYVNPGLPFYNLFVLLPDDFATQDAPKMLFKLYMDMIAEAEPKYREFHITPPFCYNLLITKHWFLFIPRGLECVENTTLSINSMGFAGTLFVRSNEHLELVRKIGPMGVLKALTLPIHKVEQAPAAL